MVSSRVYSASFARAWRRLAAALVLSGWVLAGSSFATAEEPAHSGSEKQHRGIHPESPLSVVWKWGNFLILFGGLGWYLRRPLQDFLDSRSRSIQEGLASGQAAKELAQKQLAEIESRLNRLDEEIRSLKAQAFQEAGEERNRILESAKTEAQKIFEMAQREIEGMKKAARLELKSHIAELAVRLAEERLKKSVSSDENKRLVLQFLDSLEVTKN
jgi:F-type H+-transporting ATPase subunit b